MVINKMWNASRFCVSSLRRGHANLLCIVPILVHVFRYGIHCWMRARGYFVHDFCSSTSIGSCALRFNMKFDKNILLIKLHSAWKIELVFRVNFQRRRLFFHYTIHYILYAHKQLAKYMNSVGIIYSMINRGI